MKGRATDKLKALSDRCKCGVYLTVNEHRDNYESVADWLETRDSFGGFECPDQIRREMIARNAVVELQFYPDTPVSFYRITHYDLDAALTAALECLAVNEPA